MTSRITALTMPKWGIEMTEGTITTWRVKEGDHLERGAEILDVETDKIVNAVEAPATGVLKRILAGEGEVRGVGAMIGVIAPEHASDSEVAQFIESFVAAVVSFEPPGSSVPTESAAVIDDAEPQSEDAKSSPIARRVAKRLQVDISKVTGTGRNGRVSKEDVEDYASRAIRTVAPEKASISSIHRLPMSPRQVAIARRLQESTQTVPHFRLDIDVDFGQLLLAKYDYGSPAVQRVTVSDFLIRAVALALVQCPAINAQLEDGQILQFAHADIAIAVATDAGLIAPILRQADLKSIAVIASESHDLIERARLGTLRREEITGGTFTISNLGMFGISRFDSIISVPQVAILSVGAISSRAVVRNGNLATAKVATLTLSVDHRVLDGAACAIFMASLRKLIEDPNSLLTEYDKLQGSCT
jgi:pyruvate dehydrogenase E2 component (dihydrolipoamide acetyltransferase)